MYSFDHEVYHTPCVCTCTKSGDFRGLLKGVDFRGLLKGVDEVRWSNEFYVEGGANSEN